MKILMLVNWKVEYCTEKPCNKQPPDYYLKGEEYWFYRYFKNKPDVDVLDIRSFPALEKIEKNIIRFYIWQAFRAIPRLNKYDLIVSHGMQSGVVISLWRRFFRGKSKHIVFDIGSFASASEKGLGLKLMQYASKSIDGLIYHTSSQIEYYKKCFPWIVKKSQFIRFGTDLDFFNKSKDVINENIQKEDYLLCVGYSKRDWDTLVEAYKGLSIHIKLILVGHVEKKYKGIDGIEQIGFVKITQLTRIIQGATLCVLPLGYFNYSYGQMTLMQQMAYEKCVVVAKVPSIVDYVEDDKTAVFYEPGSSIDLREKIENLLKNSSECNRKGKNARQYLENNCNEKSMALEIEKYYDGVHNDN